MRSRTRNPQYDTHEELDMDIYDYDDVRDNDFADPGGRSALRAASKNNPRNLPCLNCKAPNKLTPKDRQLGYQCDRCADGAERGID